MLLTPVSARAFILEIRSQAAQWAELHPGLVQKMATGLGPAHDNQGTFWGHSHSRHRAPSFSTRSVTLASQSICLLNATVTNHQSVYYLPEQGSLVGKSRYS